MARLEAKDYEQHPAQVALAKELALDQGLKEPVRFVLFHVAGVDVVVPRGADDLTPDNVIKMAGVKMNVDSGELVV